MTAPILDEIRRSLEHDREKAQRKITELNRQIRVLMSEREAAASEIDQINEALTRL